MENNATWEEIVSFIVAMVAIVAIIIDIVVRIIEYTRVRQKEFYNLVQRLSLFEQDLENFKEDKEEQIRDFEDMKGILKKGGFYQRERDQKLFKNEK